MSPQPITRRWMLAATGTGMAGMLAGCIGGDDSDENGDDGDDTDDTDDGDDDTDATDDTDDTEDDDYGDDDADDDDTDDDPDDGIDEEAARGLMEEAADEMQQAIDLLILAVEDDDVPLDEDTYQTHLGNASSSLDEASPVATDDQNADIDDLRPFIQYLSLRGEAEAAADEGFDEHLANGLDQYWAGRDYYAQEPVTADDLETASPVFDSAEGAFEDAETAFAEGHEAAQEGRDVLSNVKPEVVNWFDDLDYEGVEDDAEEAAWVLGEMSVFAAGHAEGCRGWSHVSLGFRDFEEEDWFDAEEQFNAGYEAFGEGADNLEAVHDDVMGFMLGYFEEVLCEIGAGQAACEHWIEAAEAAQDFEQETHEDAIDAGWEHITACHD